ncbi:MAG: hypothetical protein HY833_03150 [Candidatus Aenigmarchaeota archaeon]|nr:hypothetical protein [Candidatus Aenigmarchaeota archaeon]
MAIRTGIDLMIDYRGKVALFRYFDGFVLPGVSKIRSDETVQKAALRAARNYIGRDVELDGTVALYGPGHAALKPGCDSSLLMSAKISEEAYGKDLYFIDPLKIDGMGLSPQQEALMRSYLEWKSERKPRAPMSRTEKWEALLTKF